MSQDKEREAFEAWYLRSMGRASPRWRTGEYVANDTKAAWEAWQARAALATQPPAVQGEPVAFLANGTRFKMAFHDNADDLGNLTGGTHVTCFSNFAKELDGRWVALVAAEDDQHLRLQQPAVASPTSREVEPRKFAGWLVSNSEGDDEFINNPTALAGRHYKGRSPLLLEIHETTSGIHSRGEGES